VADAGERIVSGVIFEKENRYPSFYTKPKGLFAQISQKLRFD
jgi:hypothetical protein